MAPHMPPERSSPLCRGACSHKQHHSPSSPARQSCPQLPRSPRCDHASPARSPHCCCSRSPRRRHNSTGPRSRHSCLPGRRHAGQRGPMSASPSPHKLHHASCSPHQRHASPTPNPRHRRCRTKNSEPSPLPPADLAWPSVPALWDLGRWVKWAGGAGRQEGRHLLHTIEEILIGSLSDRNETSRQAAMPQRAWQTDAVQGLHPTYTLDTLRWWLQTTHPQAWAIGAYQAKPPSHNQGTPKGNGRGKASGKGARTGAG